MGAAAAAVIVRRERELVGHLRTAGALSPETARTIADLGVDTGFIWNRLIRRAVIREAEGGRYYLDELSWEALRGIRRRLAIAMLVILLVVLAGALLMPR